MVKHCTCNTVVEMQVGWQYTDIIFFNYRDVFESCQSVQDLHEVLFVGKRCGTTYDIVRKYLFIVNESKERSEKITCFVCVFFDILVIESIH